MTKKLIIEALLGHLETYNILTNKNLKGDYLINIAEVLISIISDIKSLDFNIYYNGFYMSFANFNSCYLDLPYCEILYLYKKSNGNSDKFKKYFLLKIKYSTKIKYFNTFQ